MGVVGQVGHVTAGQSVGAEVVGQVGVVGQVPVVGGSGSVQNIRLLYVNS